MFNKSKDTRVMALELLEKIENLCPLPINKETQEELAILVHHITSVEKNKNEFTLKTAKIIIAALKNGNEQLPFIKRLNEQISHKTEPNYKKMTPPSRVIFGLGFCLYIALSILAIGGNSITFPSDFFGISSSLIFLAAGSGAIGSIISILSRIKDVVEIDNKNHMVHFFTGLFRPLIGTTFAVFVFCIVKAGIVPIDLGDNSQEVLIVAALSFLTGFSERFANDFTRKSENLLSS